MIVGRLEAMVERCGYTGRTALNNYRLGFVQEVGVRLRDASREARKAMQASADAETNSAASQCTAIALHTLDTRVARADAAMRSKYTNIRKQSSGGARADYAARAAGQSAGRTANITRSRALR